MKKTMVGKAIVRITVGLFVGVFLIGCSSDLPISGPVAGSHGPVTNGGAGGSVGGAFTAGGGIPVIFDTSKLGGQTAGTGANPACGAAAVCKPISCGAILDPCGKLIDCAYVNCPASMCGTVTPNECTACVPLTAADCSTLGKNCGPVPDNCGGFIDCGTCTDPECCGCGGEPSVCGGVANSLGNSGLKTTCIAGHQGCLCDDRAACAPGLTCTPQTAPLPSLCCNGTDCTGPSTSIGGTCTGTGKATCTPGVTVPTATSTLDTCGYVATTFDESTILCGIFATGGGKEPAQIQAFFNDEKSMTLGCSTADKPVSAMPSNPGAVYYPQVGDPNCVDGSARPMRPTLYITDITYDPNCKAGDQQSGGTAYDPIAAFGTWKSAAESATGRVGTPGADPTPKNYWILGSAADSVPAAVTSQCPCTATSCPGSGHTAKGFGTEFKYEAGLISGHSYRLQITGHDGDQSSGGDAGEACVIFCAGTGTCTPYTCADYPTTVCGAQPDGCGGMTPECRKCCTPLTCLDYPATAIGKQDDHCGGLTEDCNENF